jgi:transcriptional regulator GlxA family with amidase domain
MQKSVEIFLYPGADAIDVTGPLEVFSVATEILKQAGNQQSGYQIRFSALHPGSVRLGSGLEVVVSTALSPATQSDYFLIPGAMDVTTLVHDRCLIDLLRQRAARSKQVVSICTGAFVLAEMGILSGLRCTTHWAYAEQLAADYPDVHVDADALYIEQGDVCTSAGVTAGIDLALALVERDFDEPLALQVARSLVLYLRRSGLQSQFSAPLQLREKAGKRFAQLHDWLNEHLQLPLNVEKMAEQAAMSPRHFARNFTAETGITPGEYIELMRMERARILLSSTQASLDLIADQSGFGREERMRRVFIKRLGVTPGQYRIRFAERDVLDRC